jgi:flavin reductase (DIM6/NTAB) family NADH-FMN oxidoreductase RutF
MPAKVALPLDKHQWQPSPLLGQVVLVSTTNADGTANVAPKSWISMMAFDPPLVALGCNLAHWTAQNILQRQAFVINVPGAELAPHIWSLAALQHPRPPQAAGLTAVPSLQVAPPRVAECKAHLECTLVQHLTFGDEVMLLGRLVALSVDEEALGMDDPYAYLRLLVYLEDGRYGVIERSHRLA